MPPCSNSPRLCLRNSHGDITQPPPTAEQCAVDIYRSYAPPAKPRDSLQEIRRIGLSVLMICFYAKRCIPTIQPVRTGREPSGRGVSRRSFVRLAVGAIAE